MYNNLKLKKFFNLKSIKQKINYKNFYIKISQIMPVNLSKFILIRFNSSNEKILNIID